MLIEKNKSYRYDFRDIFGDEDIHDEFDKLAITLPVGRTEPRYPQDYNMCVGSIRVKRNNTIISFIRGERNNMIQDPSTHLVCFVKENNGYRLFIDEDEITLLSSGECDVDVAFKWLGEPIDIAVDTFVTSFDLVNTGENYVVSFNKEHPELTDKIIIEYRAKLGYKFVDFIPTNLLLLTFEDASITLYGENVNYEISSDKKILRIILYNYTDISKVDTTDTITLYNIDDDLLIEDENTFKIELYKNSSEPHRVSKSITLVDTLRGVLRDSCSITSPVITIEIDDVPSFNYVYIPKFKRYYYVTDFVSIRNKLWNISLKVDVLMSFKTTLKTLDAYIERNENEYDDLIYDDELAFTKEKNVTLQNATMNVTFNDGEATQNLTLVLSVIGKKGTIING